MMQGTRGVWRFTLARWPVAVHWSFWLFLGLLGFNRSDGFGRWDYQGSLLFVLLGFVSVLSHELGHAFANRRHGEESSIVLYSFGGLTFSSGVIRKRRWIVSLAGPFVNLATGLPVWWLLRSDPALVTGNLLAYKALSTWVFVSVGWGLFNLLPILPLDGGSAILNIWDNLRGGDHERQVRIISMVTAGLIVLLAIVTQIRFGPKGGNDYLITVMFMLSLGLANFAALRGRGFDNEDSWRVVAENAATPEGRQAGVDRFAGREPAPNVVDLEAARKRKAKISPSDDIAEALAALERHDADRALDAIARARGHKLKSDQSGMLDELEGWAYLAARKPVLAADVVARLPRKSAALQFLDAGIALVGGERDNGIPALAVAIMDGVEGHSKTLAVELVASEGVTAEVAKAMLDTGGKGFESALRFQVALKKLGRSAHAAMVDDVILGGGA